MTPPPSLSRSRDEAMAAARRVVVKVGSSSIATVTGGLDLPALDALVETLAAARTRDTEVVLVSSGAIAAGLAPLALPRRPRDLATQQAAASVGQGLLLARYTEAFARHGHTVGQVLLTVDDVTRRTHYRNAYRTFHRLLEMGVVPVVNENDAVATHEIRFGDNDRLAALVAQLVHADVLVLLSDAGGLFDGDPRRPGARLVPVVRDLDEVADLDVRRAGAAGVGSGGMATKLEAAGIATESGIGVVLAAAEDASHALAGAPVGTWFQPSRRRRATRLLWLEHATRPHGRLLLDPGAVRALVERRTSLLPAGITGVEGTFGAGDPVDLVAAAASAVVGRGLVNYSSEELPQLLGRSTRDLARALGPEYEREVVHADDLVLFRRGLRLGHDFAD
jgi:glutamate 5-kinase